MPLPRLPSRFGRASCTSDRGGQNAKVYASRANFVRILHDDGSMALYAHLKESGVLVNVLARDIQSMRAARADLRGEADSLSHSVGHNVKALREAAADLKTESEAAHAQISEQIHTFGKTFASNLAALGHASDGVFFSNSGTL